MSGDWQNSSSNYILPEMSTIEHLTELRRRLIVAIVCFVAASGIGWLLVPLMLESFAMDVGRQFVFVSPAEGFMTHLKLALLAGLFLSAPVILYQAWQFILPGLFPHEQKLARRFVVPSLLLFVGGIAFSYFAVYPLALIFLLGFGSQDVEPTIAIARFVTFFVSVTLPFGLVFQFPIIIVLLVRLQMVSLVRLRNMRRVVYFLAFVVGALLTPPDVASQVLMAIPIILLYELTLWILSRGGGQAGH